MDGYDLLVRNGAVVDPTSTSSPRATDIAIAKGKICALASPGQLPAQGTRVIDASGFYVFPGLIDPHVHITDRVAGSIRAGFQLTSRAAIHGGSTTFFDVTIPLQGPDLLSALDQQIREAEGVVFSDFCLHAGVPPMNLEDLWQVEAAINRGFPSFKSFMLSSRGRPEIEDGLLFALLSACKQYGGLMAVHAENGRLISHFSQKLLKEGNDRNFLSEPRPPRTQNCRRCAPVAAVPEPQAATAGNTPMASLFFGQTISDMYLLRQPELDFRVGLDIDPGLE